MRIRSRFLIFLLSFYSLILIVGIALQFSTHRVFNNYLYAMVNEIFNATVGSFTGAIENLEQVSVTILSDELIQRFLNTESDEITEFKLSREREALIDRLSFHARANPFIKELVLIDKLNHHYQINVGSFDSILFSELISIEIKKRMTELAGKAFWSKSKSALLPVVLSRQINEIGAFKQPSIGQLFIFADIETLLDETLSQINYYGVKTDIKYMGTPFYSSKGGGLEGIRQVLGKRQYDTVQINGEKHFAAVVSTGDKNWDFLFLIPTSSLFNDLNRINLIVYSIFFALFIMFVLVIIRASGQFAAPVIALSNAMKLVDEKDFDASIPRILLSPENASEEVSLLYYEFHQMIDKIDTLVNKNLKQQLSLKQSQLETLSLQLNPHFLYNTLDSLYWMAELNKNPEMASMIKALGALLRSSLSKAGALITVKEQLDLLNDYFFIQKIRLKNRLEYQIDVDYQLYYAEIPRFTLQPLVENSIKYTLESGIETCRVDLSIQRHPSGQGLQILISDNGPGFSQKETLRQGTGIGLSNLKKRLTLLYEEESCLTILTNGNGGTDVLISIPPVQRSAKGSDAS